METLPLRPVGEVQRKEEHQRDAALTPSMWGRWCHEGTTLVSQEELIERRGGCEIVMERRKGKGDARKRGRAPTRPSSSTNITHPQRAVPRSSSHLEKCS